MKLSCKHVIGGNGPHLDNVNELFVVRFFIFLLDLWHYIVSYISVISCLIRGIKNYQAVDIGGLTTKVTNGGLQMSMCLFVNNNVALKPETHADSPFLKANGFIIHKCLFIKI